MRKIYAIWAALLFLAPNVWAQSTLIQGTVMDEFDFPLPGANVVLRDAALGTTTDIDGNFSIEAPEDGILEITFMGYRTYVHNIDGQNNFTITMVPDSEQLDEVVVTALGISRDKKALGYSTQEVSGENLSTGQETNVVNAMGGKVAGVQVYGSSNMGGSSRIVLRGVNSVTGNNQPLFIVDGVPLDNSSFTSSNQESGGGGYDYGSAIADLNPDDIESMNVLKGAAASALYGTRASNGVIIITTKKGANNDSGRIGVDYSYGIEFSNVAVLPEYQNEYGGGYSQDWADYATDANGNPIPSYSTDESWGPKLDGTQVRPWWSWDEGYRGYGQTTAWAPQPDNVKDFYQTGVSQRHSVSFGGANEKGDFRVGYTFQDATGVQPNSELTKNNISFNGSYKLTDKLKASVGANYVNTQATGRQGTGYDANNVSQQFNQWGQRQWDNEYMQDYKNPDGTQRSWNRTSPTNPAPKYADNPYWTVHENYQNDKRDRFFGNVALDYQLNDKIKFTARATTDFYNEKRYERIAVGSVEQSKYNERTIFVKEDNIDVFGSYTDTFNDIHSFTAILGGNTRYNANTEDFAETQGGLIIPDFYNIANSNAAPYVSEFSSQKRVNAIYGSFSYGYNYMFYLDGTFRNEWSSTLPAGENSYFFPSISASFVFSEVLDTDWLSFGKFRAGWAKVGGDTNPYNLYTYYETESGSGQPRQYVPYTLNNAELRPEITTEYEAGVEMTLWQGLLGFDLTYYNRTTFDQIMPVAVSPTTGYTEAWMNVGAMNNKGVEFALNATPISTDNGFEWTLNFNIAKNVNEVLELADGVDNLQMGSLFGATVNATEGQPYGTIMGYGFARDENGNKIVDENGYYVASDQPEVLGNAMADFTGGFGTSFKYKSFNLNINFSYQKGGDVFSVTNMFGTYSGMFEETVANGIRETGIVPEGVTLDGNPNTTLISAQDYYKGMYGIHEAYVYDCSYLSLDEVSIGYTLPKQMVQKIGFDNIKVSAYGRNLWLIHSNLPNIDPRNLAVSSGNIQGLEGGASPSVRSFGFGLNIGF